MSKTLPDLHQRIAAYHANLLELRKKETSTPEANVSTPKSPAANGGQKSFGQHPATRSLNKDEIVPSVAAGKQPKEAPAGQDAADNRDDYVGGEITPGAKAANDLMSLIEKGAAIKGGPAAEGIAKAALNINQKPNGGKIVKKGELDPHAQIMGHLTKKPVNFTAQDNAFFEGKPATPAAAPAAAPAPVRAFGTMPYSGGPAKRSFIKGEQGELSKAEASSKLMSLIKQEIYIDHSGKAEGNKVAGSDRLVEVGAVKEAKASNPFKEGKKAVSKKLKFGHEAERGGKITKGKGVAKEESSGEESSEESSSAEESSMSKAEPLSKPPVSEAQRRAMGAAAGGKSTLGIPKKVGKEFIEADKGGKLPETKKGELEKKDMLAPPGKLNALTPASINKPGGTPPKPMVPPQAGAAAGKPPTTPGASDMKPPTATAKAEGCGKKYEMSKKALDWAKGHKKATGGQIVKKDEPMDKGAMFDENMNPIKGDSNQMTAQMAHPKATTQVAGTGAHGLHARAVPVKRPAPVAQPLRRSEKK